MTRQSEISMGLITNIAIAEAAGNITSILTGGDVGGIMQTVTQQLGLGLMLSTLLITVPPMAGMWFNGVMGSFSPYAVIGGGNRQEVPPHLDSGASRQQVVTNVDERMTHSHTQHQQPISSISNLYQITQQEDMETLIKALITILLNLSDSLRLVQIKLNTQSKMKQRSIPDEILIFDTCYRMGKYSFFSKPYIRCDQRGITK
ncbi:hypothetical protein [uncultured Neisseria sp.]|uniref:hypothetical protein n=1 Tax=uncultured Neisseria sp. TaxID=237778 RepID=UPI0026171034|nr:hypothetical protein [uncultured Neisseria sp.]